MKKLAKKTAVVKTITSSIVNMINYLPRYGGSAEVEWAYKDFRYNIQEIFDARDSNIRFTDEDALNLGKEILKSFNKNLKTYNERFTNE